jgi:hypothetical protein
MIRACLIRSGKFATESKVVGLVLTKEIGWVGWFGFIAAVIQV